MRRFFLDKESIHSDKPTLTGSDVKHIRTVLRLKPSDEIYLFDGRGSEYRARIMDSTPQAIELLVLDQYRTISESCVEITIGQALLKARKMDRIIRQLTELGAVAFFPFVAKRSIPRPDTHRLAARRERWETIARESLKQCGRSRGLYLGSVVSFEELVRRARSYDLNIIFHNDGHKLGSQFCSTDKCHVRNVLALIGPEGGFTDEEVKLARKFDFICASLGPSILKADTAAITVLAILQHTFGGLGNLPKRS